MTESRIRSLFFAAGATAVWVLLAYVVLFHEAGIGDIIGIGLIAFLLMIAAAGQGEK